MNEVKTFVLIRQKPNKNRNFFRLWLTTKAYYLRGAAE
jgi:hypothetical protein